MAIKEESGVNKLEYQGDDKDGYSVYHMYFGGKVVFQLKASKDETNQPIYVKFPDYDIRSTAGWAQTTHRAFLVDDKSRISAMSMKEAAYMNLPYILVGMLYGHA